MRGDGRLITHTARAVAVSAALIFAAPATAQVEPPGTDDAGGFYSVLSPGQGENLNSVEAAPAFAGSPPASFSSQIPMWSGLIQAAPTLQPGDLDRFYKSAGFGVRPDDVNRRYSPRPGVTILRDRHNVPRVYANTRADGLWGVGYAQAEDRLFQIDVLTSAAQSRSAEVGGAAFVAADARTFRHLPLTPDAVAERREAFAKRWGTEAQQVLTDLSAWLEGVNAYVREVRADPERLPAEYPVVVGALPQELTLDDVLAFSAVIATGSTFADTASDYGIGEIRRMFGQRFGRRQGAGAFRDIMGDLDPEARTTVARRHPVDPPGRPRRRALALPDPGSVTIEDPSSGDDTGGSQRGNALESLELFPPNSTRSNAVLVAARHSKSGRPLAVMGGQSGLSTPPVVHHEWELHAPGFDVRGSGIGPYPATGRGRDFAWSLSDGIGDVTDQFAERLCEPAGSAPTLQSEHYLYRGRCVPFGVRRIEYRTAASPGALFLSPTPPRTVRLEVRTSVHGPVQARATVRGRPVAYAEMRSSRLRELDSLIMWKRLAEGRVRDGSEFRRTVRSTAGQFNVFFLNRREIAYASMEKAPRRAPGMTPSLPAWGTGEWDWRGFDTDTGRARLLPGARQPSTVNPRSGMIANWNNRPAPGWRGGWSEFSWRSVGRVDLLARPIEKALRRGSKLDLADLVRLHQLAATQDLRGVEVYPWLRRLIGRTKDPDLRPLLEALDEWAAAGSHRRDLDGDNVYEHSAGVLLMDAWWERLVPAIFSPALGAELYDAIERDRPISQHRFTQGGGFFTGWWAPLEKDVRRLLGRRVRGPLSRRWCGDGDRAKCRAIVAETLADAAAALRQEHDGDLSEWEMPATCAPSDPPRCDQVVFAQGGIATLPPIPGQNRPTFEQAVEVGANHP